MAENPQTGIRQSDGFSLLEMLVVIAIIGIVTSIAAIGLNVLQSRNSPSSLARDIASMLTAARFEAVSSGRPQTVRIDMRAKLIAKQPGSDQVRIPASFELKVTIGTEAATGAPDADVVFLPDGSSSGAEITVSDTKGQHVMVRTNWLTGLTGYRDENP